MQQQSRVSVCCSCGSTHFTNAGEYHVCNSQQSLEGASKGEGMVIPVDPDYVHKDRKGYQHSKCDELITHLEQQLRETEAQRDHLRECLKRLEWCDGQGFCPGCGESEPDGHASDC